MFIRLTNATQGRLGDPILINVHTIISVYEQNVEGSLRTIVYGSTANWEVEESFNQVQKKIEEALNNK